MLQVYLKDTEYKEKLLNFLDSSREYKNKIIFVSQKELLKKEKPLLTDCKIAHSELLEKGVLLSENTENLSSNILDKYKYSFDEILNRVLPSGNFEIIAVSSTCGGAGKSLFIEHIAKNLEKSSKVAVLNPFCNIYSFCDHYKNQDLSDLVLEYNHTKDLKRIYTVETKYCKCVFEPFSRAKDAEEINPKDLFDGISHYAKSKSINYLIYEVTNSLINIDKYFISFAKQHFVLQDLRRAVQKEPKQTRENVFFIYNFSNKSFTPHLPDISSCNESERIYQEKIETLCRSIQCKKI